MQGAHAGHIFVEAERALAVEGVGERGVGQGFAHAGFGGGIELRERDAIGLRRICREGFDGAGIGHDGDARALGARHAREVSGGLHHVLQRIDAHDAHIPREGVEDLRGARQRARMGEGRLARLLRAARLHGHDGLAITPRFFGGGEKGRAIGDRFDVAGDDTQIGIISEMVDVIGEGEARLVAAGHEIGERQARIGNAAREGLPEHAALGDGGHGARRQRRQLLVGEGAEFRAPDRKAHAIGTGGGDGMAVQDFLEAQGPGATIGIAAFAKARRIDGGAAHAKPATKLQNFKRLLLRHKEREMVGRLGQIGDGGIAALAPDLVAIGVHRIDPALVAEALQVIPDARRPVAVGGADEDDIARRHQGANVGGKAHR